MKLSSIDSVLARRPALANCKTRADMVELACVTAGKATDLVFQLEAELEECKAENARLTAEVEEWKKKAEFWKKDSAILETARNSLNDEIILLRAELSDLRTLRRSSVRVDVLLRWMFSAEPWNSPAVNWSILNRILIARSRRSTPNKKG